MQKYRVSNNTIRAYEVVSESVKQLVFIRNDSKVRELKDSEYHKWFDDLTDAVNFAIKQIDEEITKSNKRIINLMRSKEQIYLYNLDAK